MATLAPLNRRKLTRTGPRVQTYCTATTLYSSLCYGGSRRFGDLLESQNVDPSGKIECGWCLCKPKLSVRLLKYTIDQSKRFLPPKFLQPARHHTSASQPWAIILGNLSIPTELSKQFPSQNIMAVCQICSNHTCTRLSNISC